METEKELSETELFYAHEEIICTEREVNMSDEHVSYATSDDYDKDLIQVMDIELENADFNSPFSSLNIEHEADNYLNLLLEISLRKWRFLRKPEKNLHKAIQLKTIINKITAQLKAPNKKRRLEESRQEKNGVKKTKSKLKTVVRPWMEE